jgi:hypothetical protein
MNVALDVMIADVMGAKGLLGVPPQIAMDALRKTAIDFCTQTTIWEYHGQVATQANVADYPLDVPEDARIASMRWMTLDGASMGANPRIVPTPFMQAMNPNSFYSMYGTGYTMEGRDFIWLSPVPVDDTGQVMFCAALKPTQQACSIPEFLYQDWNDALTSGTAYRLFLMPKQEWTNNGLGIVNQKEYSRWIGRARFTKSQNYSQAGVMASGSYF